MMVWSSGDGGGISTGKTDVLMDLFTRHRCNVSKCNTVIGATQKRGLYIPCYEQKQAQSNNKLRATTRSEQQQGQSNNKVRETTRSEQQQGQSNNKLRATARSEQQQAQSDNKVRTTTSSEQQQATTSSEQQQATTS
ncbi:hypothetical protein ACOMHN_036556 [Nucella lapillus]